MTSTRSISENAVAAAFRFGTLVGRSAQMQTVAAELARAAATSSTVLLEGETGTGKEEAARSIHERSDRAAGPFVVVDCGAVPREIFESELFGHERGAFTGAHDRRVGAFADACGGTIFLDEIGELALELQPKLLRALERREVRRLGSSTYRPIDVRLVAATNRDLSDEVKLNRFRADLFFRLAVIKVRMPPLRERVDDIPTLVFEILERMGRQELWVPFFEAPGMVEKVRRYVWPGNVRELRNFVERYVVMGERAELDEGAGGARPLDLDAPSANDKLSAGDCAPLEAALATANFFDARRDVLEAWERQYLTALLRDHGGRIESAANAAGIGRAYLYRLVARHNLLPKSAGRGAREPSARS